MYCSTWIGLSPLVPKATTPSTASSTPATSPPHRMALGRVSTLVETGLATELIGTPLSRGATEEFTDSLRNEDALLFKREVPSIQKVKLRIRQVAQECLCAVDSEERIVLPPDDQRSWLLLAEVLVPFVIERYV